MSRSSCESKRHGRRLWVTSSSQDDDGDDDESSNNSITTKEIHQQDTYESIVRRFSSKPITNKSFLELTSNAVVVVQEFGLSCFFLARHRMALWMEENRRPSPSCPRSMILQQQDRLNLSTMFILLALVVSLIYSSKADEQLLHQRQSRKTKVRQRVTDSFLLGILLRYTASMLRTLTSSYSSDTVLSLSTTGMAVHLFTCDYSYANGRESIQKSKMYQLTAGSQRPVFKGGTISLNAALFSTTLLNSRLSSNATAYTFVSLSIVLFAFYPVTRHAISASYPASSTCAYIIKAFSDIPSC